MKLRGIVIRVSDVKPLAKVLAFSLPATQLFLFDLIVLLVAGLSYHH